MARKQALTPDEIEAERSALRVEQQDITVAGDVLRAEVKNLHQHPTREVLTSLAERLHEHSARLRAFHERLDALHAAGANLGMADRIRLRTPEL